MNMNFRLDVSVLLHSTWVVQLPKRHMVREEYDLSLICQRYCTIHKHVSLHTSWKYDMAYYHCTLLYRDR